MFYEIWLSWNNKEEEFQLPINPSSIKISQGSNSTTYDLVDLGEINVIKSPKLLTYSFDSIFPARQDYPFANAQILSGISSDGVFYNPYVYYLTKWMRTKRPIRFMMFGGRYTINTPASIESFEWKESAGSGGDIEYSLSLKQYVFYTAQRVSLHETAAGTGYSVAEPDRPDDRQTPTTYTMVAGDNLWKIAQTKLGDGSRWKEIQQLNGISDAEIRRLPVGKVLKLPT